jgi:hypothetical protein
VVSALERWQELTDDPDASMSALRSAQEAVLAELSDDELARFLRGELVHSGRARRRLLRDASGGATGVTPRFAREAVALFEQLQRHGGAATLASLRRTQLQRSGVLDDAIADLTTLGLVRQIPRQPGERMWGAATVSNLVELTPDADGLVLVSEWTRAG